MTSIDDWRKEWCWETTTEKQTLFNVWVDGVCHGIPYDKAVGAQYHQSEETLSILWAKIQVVVIGTDALAFYRRFCEGRATMLKANGKEILSVTLEEFAEDDPD